MIPAPRLFIFLSFGILAGLGEVSIRLFWSADANLIEQIRYGLGIYFCVLMILSLLDGLGKRHQPSLEIQRVIPSVIPVDKWLEVKISIKHTFASDTRIKLFDQYPTSEKMEGLPVELTLEPGKTSSLSYWFKPLNRGELRFQPSHVLQTSFFGFWQFSSTQGNPSMVKVYPDISRIKGYIHLATSHQTAQLGIRLQQRRGEGMEFHQLREFQQGDSPRRIDWKASSRRQKLIAREYQDEKDQQVIFMLDSGRNMRSKDENLSHFDHALNALLLLSYVALHEGDAVGLLSFSGEQDRWMKPVKSVGGINQILSTLYDLQPSTRASDYLKAAEYLKAHYQKRSLIILISNLRDEATADLTPALSLLVKDHLVLFANLREMVLNKTLAAPVQTFDQALGFYGTFEYLKQRNKGQKRINQMGVSALDVTPDKLPIHLVNSYYSLKRSAKL